VRDIQYVMMKNIQDDSGEEVNNLGGESTGFCEKKC
jgi:hypothetical protein